MVAWPAFPMIRRRYFDAYGAHIERMYSRYLRQGGTSRARAALGYTRGRPGEPFYCERYLDSPVEALVSARLGHSVQRENIIEIGNLVADNGLAMLALWGAAANDLAAGGEVAIATLTTSLRSMFARVGVPIEVLAPARREALGVAGVSWGEYYARDPQVCFGDISLGQAALSRFMARRSLDAA